MRLIDADVLAQKWQDVLDQKADEKDTVAYLTFELFIDRLKEEPTIDPEELRPKGEWVWTENGEADYEQYWVCSCCGKKDYIEENYCPNCGAKMRGADG